MAIIPQGLQKLTPRIRKTLGNTNLQQKAKFDFLIFRTPGDSTTGGALDTIVDVIGAGEDLYVAKTYVQSITFGNNKASMERINGDVYTKDIEYSDSVMITFLDDENGIVMRYLQDWFNDIMIPASTTSARKGYIFRDNQEKARRTGMLLMANRRGKFPPRYPRTTFYGMVPKAIQDITVGQDEQGILTYNVDFSVREVRTTRFI